MEKLAIFKKVKDGKEYFAVYKVVIVNGKKNYELVGFLSSYQVECSVRMEVK